MRMQNTRTVVEEEAGVNDGTAREKLCRLVQVLLFVRGMRVGWV